MALLPLFLLAGCQGMYMHNPSRASLAAAAKKNVDSVDVPSITRTEHENLEKILAEEIKSIEARQNMVARLATIQLAASGDSVAYQYGQAQRKMKLALGTDSVLKLHQASQCQINREAAAGQLPKLEGMLRALGVKRVPPCAEATNGIAKPADLAPALSAEFDNSVAEYRKQCKLAQQDCGTIASREASAVAAARAVLEKLRDEERKSERALKGAKDAYRTALAENKKKAGTHTEQEIRDKAKAVIDAADKALEVSPSAANKVKGSAIIELLTAAAGGKTNANDPELAPALVAAREIPALAGSIDEAAGARRMVPISHLLLALNDLTIQAERDARFAELAEQDVALAEQKLEMRNRQGRLWRRYSDQLCNLAYLAARGDYPRSSCEIEFPDPLPKKGLSCTIRRAADPKPVVLEDCILQRSWQRLLSERLGDPNQQRAVYEAAAAYLQVRLNAYQTTIEEFRRVDLLHRRAVVAREAALLQWKNLVAVPADELNGYYAGGVKPAEFADLIVKAAGFAAIAIGVAQ